MYPLFYKKSEHLFIHSSNTLLLIAFPIAYIQYIMLPIINYLFQLHYMVHLHSLILILLYEK